jgi:hypothetical protein
MFDSPLPHPLYTLPPVAPAMVIPTTTTMGELGTQGNDLYFVGFLEEGKGKKLADHLVFNINHESSLWGKSTCYKNFRLQFGVHVVCFHHRFATKMLSIEQPCMEKNRLCSSVLYQRGNLREVERRIGDCDAE